MKIAIGADHAGFRLKEHVRDHLRAEGHEVVDVGTSSEESTDYPDYAKVVAQDVSAGKADRGVLVCSTGIGMSIAANKVHGVRAAVGASEDTVRLTRAHNNANVLSIGERMISLEVALNIVDIWLTTEFEGGRHENRIAELARYEAGQPMQ